MQQAYSVGINKHFNNDLIMYNRIFALAKWLALNYDSSIALRPFHLSFKGVYPMRKLMLGAVLLAAMLPVTTVYAAGEAKANYLANKSSKAAKKNAEDAIAEGVAKGLSVEDALAEIMEADPNNAPIAVAAAIKADPDNASSITSFAIGKAPLQAAAITSAALRAVTTPEARAAVAAAAKTAGVPASTVNTLVADAARTADTNTETVGTTTPPGATPPSASTPAPAPGNGGSASPS